MAKTLILIGLVVLAAGLLMHFAPGLLNWFGHLPGDIRIEKENTRIYIPITSMILVSLILTLIANFWR
ncbi:DUF2905 domain-containing protein [Endozoicomonas sp. ONNA1]|uniref:DUF2905 domain-containing protein n=1 Tax=unclassified Endozoicomonas TaxID=2644528 RepID=UPI002148D2D2|nr:DUF2905 domain-containing protein [Endozoicomonas sp. ONNA1]